MCVSQEFVSLLKLCFNIMTNTRVMGRNEERDNIVSKILSWIDRLYHTIINKEDAKLDEVVIFAEISLFISVRHVSARRR